MTHSRAEIRRNARGWQIVTRDTIVRTTVPLVVKRCGPGATWSVRLGPTGHFWFGGGRTVWTEDEARAAAERTILAALEPYRERIPSETEVTFEEFLQIVGVRAEVAA